MLLGFSGVFWLVTDVVSIVNFFKVILSKHTTSYGDTFMGTLLQPINICTTLRGQVKGQCKAILVWRSQTHHANNGSGDFGILHS